jgi:hypothetical protein
MKGLLIKIIHFFSWASLMVTFVFVCAWVEYDFNLNPSTKSDNLGFYWITGAFVYPLIRFIWQLITTKKAPYEPEIDTLSLQKESSRLEREKKIEKENQLKEQQLLLYKQQYHDVNLAFQNSEVSKKLLLSKLENINKKIQLTEENIIELSSQLKSIGNRHSLLNDIIGGSGKLSGYKRKMTKLQKSSQEISCLLVKD